MHTTLFLLLSLTLAAGTAQAEDKFQRKSGLWEVKRTSGLWQKTTFEMCIDKASDDAFSRLAEGARSERCKAEKTRREGDKLIVDAVCELRQGTIKATTHAVISGSFDSAYKIESKSTLDPPIRGKAQDSAVLDATWTGPCKPDQHPGDFVRMHEHGEKADKGSTDRPGSRKRSAPTK